jgi:hypothetical protein
MKHLIIIAILLFAATVYSDEQQSQYDECYYNYNAFLAGPYSNAANKREIVMKCGQPHHAERQQVVSGGVVITIGEEWYYYFEDDIFIFTFNNKGKLIKKNWKRE